MSWISSERQNRLIKMLLVLQIWQMNWAAMNIDDEIGSITFIGLCTDICVISNALLVKAALPEIPIIVDAACCAGVTPESHENALNAMKICQIDIVG